MNKINSFQACQDKAVKMSAEQKKYLSAGYAATQDTCTLSNWSEPESLHDESLLPVNKFHPSLLPSALQGYVLEFAKRMDNTAPDFSAVSVIVCLGSLAGGNVQIQPKSKDNSWTIGLTLWGGVIGVPSTKKSPSLQAGLNLLKHVQDKIIKPKVETCNLTFEVKRKAYDKRYAQLETKAASAFELGKEDEGQLIITEMTNLSQPEPPYNRNILINDCTTEALICRLKDNPAGVLYFRDELIGWLNTMDLSNREHERAFYLECFNASSTPYIQERISRENVTIQRAILSLLGGIQPSMLRPLVEEKIKGHNNDGLFERLIQLCVYPDQRFGETTDLAENKSLTERAKKVFEKVAELNTALSPITFKFDKNAQFTWDSWAKKMLVLERSSDEVSQSAFGKYPALCAKLALVMHIIEEADSCEYEKFSPSTKIKKRELLRAISWINYLITHFQRIIEIGKSRKNFSPAIVLEKNLSKLYPEFDKQKLSQRNWKNLNTASDRDHALKVLTEKGYLKLVANPKRYLVHPNYAELN